MYQHQFLRHVPATKLRWALQSEGLTYSAFSVTYDTLLIGKGKASNRRGKPEKVHAVRRVHLSLCVFLVPGPFMGAVRLQTLLLCNFGNSPQSVETTTVYRQRHPSDRTP